MILVTGGAGYIGSHCVLKLLETGNDVVVFDSLETGHIETIETLKSVSRERSNRFEFVEGDLKNFDDINKVFKMYDIESVIHFGAFSLVEESVNDPQKYYYNNVYGSLNLFKSMLENSVNMIVFSSTAATYGEPKTQYISETHPQLPINPYGASKLMIERILDDYSKAYGLKSVRLRYFNVAGADSLARVGEWHEPETHLIPNILKSVSESGRVFKLYGDDYDTVDGTCVRDYINIDDLIEAHLLALDYLKEGGDTDFFNLGTTEGSSVKQVFDMCESVTGSKIDIKIEGRRSGDPAILVADNKKAQQVLGWSPKNSLRTSIETAYSWEKRLTKK